MIGRHGHKAPKFGTLVKTALDLGFRRTEGSVNYISASKFVAEQVFVFVFLALNLNFSSLKLDSVSSMAN